MPADRACAWFWYGLAERSGWEYAGERRAALEPGMSAGEIAEGRRLLAKAKVPKGGPLLRPLCADETISLRLEAAPLAELLAVFSQLSGREIVPPEGTTARVAIEVEDLPWPRALEKLLEPLGLTWIADGDRLRIVRPPA